MQRRVITSAKHTESRGWLAEVASVALVQSVRDARRAYRNRFDDCGAVAESMPLAVRTWTCGCGAIHDRDYNAARTMLAAGRAERRDACGADVSPPAREATGEEAGSTLLAA